MSVLIDSALLIRARHNRLDTLANIQSIMESLSLEELRIKEGLLKLSPKEAIWFLKEELVIECLIKYGQYSSKIYFNNDLHGFKNPDQVKDLFKKIKMAWKDCVLITYSEGENHRIEVSLKIP